MDHAMQYFCADINAGIEKPFKVLHVSDSHITFTDERDDLRKRILGQQRTEAFARFPNSTRIFLEQAMDYGRKNCDLIVYTGDLMDFVSVPNLEFFAEFQKEEKLFFAVGNHEFSLYVGEAFEDTAYKMQSFEKVESRACNKLDFASKVVNGVNFVAIDNSYYLFSERHLELLKKELDRGFPVILCMHNPLFVPEVGEYLVKTSNSKCSFMVDAPQEMLDKYDDYRKKQQTPDEPTRKFVDFCRGENRIKAILAGHLHKEFFCVFNGTIPQFIAPATYGAGACVYNIY